MSTLYEVMWDNGAMGGALPGLHRSRRAAEKAGAEWKAAMVGGEHRRNRKLAEQQYQWRVAERGDRKPKRKNKPGAGRPAVTMPCGWGCGAILSASGMRAHFTTCPKRPGTTTTA